MCSLIVKWWLQSWREYWEWQSLRKEGAMKENGKSGDAFRKLSPTEQIRYIRLGERVGGLNEKVAEIARGEREANDPVVKASFRQEKEEMEALIGRIERLMGSLLRPVEQVDLGGIDLDHVYKPKK